MATNRKRRSNPGSPDPRRTGTHGPSAPTTFRLYRTGQYVFVDPPCPELENDFYTVRHGAVEHPDHGYFVVPGYHPLVAIQPDDEVVGDFIIKEDKYSVAYAGLEPLIIEWMQRRGYQIELAEERPKPLPPPHPFRLTDRLEADMDWLGCIRQHDRALVRYRRGKVKPARLIAQVALAWPKKKIMVWVTRRQEVHEVGKQLAKYGLDVTQFHGDYTPAEAGRVVVSTYACLGIGAIEIEKRPIAIVLDPAEMLVNFFGKTALAKARNARLYGLMPDDVELPPFARDRVTALLGFPKLHIRRHGDNESPTNVVFCKITGGQSIDLGLSPLEVKRQGVWRHPVRSRRIAALARAVATGDESVLADKFPGVLKRIAWPGALSIDEPVGILVENVEHALVLAERLPGWSVVTADDICQAGLSRRQRQILRDGGDQQRGDGHVIVTWEGLSRVKGLDVLIRADAGQEAYPVTQSNSICPNRNLPGLILDFADKHHPLLRRWARQRKQDYVAQGWDTGDEDIEASPLEQFLSTRPEVVKPW